MSKRVRAPLDRRAKKSTAPRTAVADEWALLDEVGFSQQVGFMLRRAQLALLDHVDSGPQIGLTHSQLLVLRLIAGRPALTQQRIADALRVKKANLSPLIDELVAQGLVLRENSSTQPKAYALHPTLKGVRLAEKAKAIVTRHTIVFDDILDQGERDHLVKLLRKLAVELPVRSSRST